MRASPTGKPRQRKTRPHGAARTGWVYSAKVFTVAAAAVVAPQVSAQALDGAKGLPQLPPWPDGGGGGLPVISAPHGRDIRGLAFGQSIRVVRFRFVGNTVLSEEELDEIGASYLERALSFSELIALRDEITQAYVSRGYVNSGAVVPLQAVENGVLTINLVEGRLTDVEYSTDGRFRKDAIVSRLRHGVTGPLNVSQLESTLQVLQQDDRIESVQAALLPAGEPGTSRLRLRLTESRPVHVIVQADNYESPSVGAEGVDVRVTHANVTGFGDRLGGEYRRTWGLEAVTGRYRVPLSAGGATLEVQAQRSRGEVIEPPFDRLDIESESESYELAVHMPLTRTPERRSALFLAVDYRRSESFLLGAPFNFSLGAEQGVSKVAVVRLGYERSFGSRERAWAFRSALSRGVDALGSTIQDAGHIPDSRFLSLLVQVQGARRLSNWRGRLLGRFDGQIADSPLLGLEQFALGGHGSVRGYRENTLVRDQGWVVSAEVRLPVGQASGGQMEIGWFLDHGRAWNRQRGSGDERYLTSTGLSWHWQMTRSVNFRLDFAKRLKTIPDGPDHDLQDEGLHFRVTAAY